ncbi:TlpA family protein disulfide reductase [Alistipes sp. OttesenSCG-928-B03]|nr:TlpA family protein disulfide reductase [Alistipes sp. OttesenSCG-928-B03]
MKKTLLFAAAMLVSLSAFAQESNNGKKLWAKSVLNEKAPILVVEKWLGDAPETEGKFVIVDFWATWCGPCKKAIPEMNEFSKKFKDDLVVIGLSDETEEQVKAMTSPVIEYYSAIDTQKRMSNALEVKGVPHVIVIDPEGIVRWEGFPTLQGHELTEEVIAGLIAKYKKK